MIEIVRDKPGEDPGGDREQAHRRKVKQHRLARDRNTDGELAEVECERAEDALPDGGDHALLSQTVQREHCKQRKNRTGKAVRELGDRSCDERSDDAAQHRDRGRVRGAEKHDCSEREDVSKAESDRHAEHQRRKERFNGVHYDRRGGEHSGDRELFC